MTRAATRSPPPRRPAKFSDPDLTADGQARASVTLRALRTLWFNTGTLCNLTCRNCYIESSPTNDSLVYLSAAEVASFLDEIAARGLATEEIGFTGGEPFMNPDLMAMMADALERGFRVLVLTNAMRPMMKSREALLALRERHGRRLAIRVSIDHPTREGHESLRGENSWRPTMEGVRWLADNGFALDVAGRAELGGGEIALRRDFARLFAENGIAVDAEDKARLVLFPEMDERAEVPEITESCWRKLGVDPGNMMCATSRMVVRRRHAAAPEVLACTLLPYDPAFSLGASLAEATRTVKLNHPHCAKFCVLGGATCGADG